MRVQSLLFSRTEGGEGGRGWTESAAKAWAKKEGFKTGTVDVTDKYIRLRQQDPGKFTVKRTKTFGNGIRAVVAREKERVMATKGRSTSHRRHAGKKGHASKKGESRSERSRAAKKGAAHRRPKRRHAREARRVAAPTARTTMRSPKRAAKRSTSAAEARRPKRRHGKHRKSHRAKETTTVLEARRPSKHRKKSSHRRKSKKVQYAMARRPKKSSHRRHPSKHRRKSVQAWHGDSAGHSKAAKKGWKARRRGKKVSEARRTAGRRPSRRRTTEEARVLSAARRPSKHRRSKHAAHRKPHHQHRRGHAHRASEARRAPRRYAARAVPSLQSIARTAGELGIEVGTAFAGFLLADTVDRFLATYNPSSAKKPGADKFTSDGAGTLGNALNVASPPDLLRWGALGAMALLPIGGSLFVKHKATRAAIEGVGIGAALKLVSTAWSSVLMPLLVGKDTSVPALQKSVVARLYPSEVSAVLNIKAGKAAVSSGGANSTAGTLSGADAGPYALGGRFDRHDARHERGWIAPSPWQQPIVPTVPDVDVPFDPNAVIPAPAPVVVGPPAWPAHWGERHRHGLRGVGDAVQDMAATVAADTGVHPAHAVNAAMHVAAEPSNVTAALQRALPHVRRELLHECARHVHPHVARMHAHARHPREHAEWEAERAAEGFPPPDHGAPESEWREWHGKRAQAGLGPAPHPPEPPKHTPAHLWSRREWHPNYAREIQYDRFPSVQQVLGIGAGGPATAGNPGQPGVGDAFADAAQAAGAAVPGLPLENAVNVAANAAAEPFSCQRVVERAMPHIRRELARLCAESMRPHLMRMQQEAGIPLPPEAPGAAPLPPPAPSAPLPPAPVVEFMPSPPPPGWTRSEVEWHEQERRDWDRAHGSPLAVVVAAHQAAQAAAAPHPDAGKPAVREAIKAVADKAAAAAAAAPPGAPHEEIHAAAKQAAESVAAEHPAVAAHPAVQAALKAAPSAAANAASAAPAVAAAATQAAQAAAAPHADASKPAVAAAINAAATGAAQAATSAAPGTPTPVVAQAAHEAARAAAAALGPAAADHPAVHAAVQAAAPAAAQAAAPGGAGTAGVGNPPRGLPVGPPRNLPLGPHVPTHPTKTHEECGCDSPFLGLALEDAPDDDVPLYRVN